MGCKFEVSTVFGLTLLLSACASPSEMRAKPPAQVFTSSADAKSVAVCIANKWENLGVFGSTLPISMRPTMTGYTVSLVNPQSAQTQLLVDIDEATTGSITRYFKHIVLGEGAFDNALAACQSVPNRAR